MIDCLRHYPGSSPRFAPRIATAVLITVVCFAIQPDAFAETLYIEAETHFESSVIPNDGGLLSLALLDDLNHPVQNMPVEISIGQIETGENTIHQANTDADGRLSLPLGLTPGKYQADLIFRGRDAYIGTRDSQDIDITACHIQTRLVFAEDTPTYTEPKSRIQHILYHAGEPLRFTLQPEPPICTRQPLVYIVSFGPQSKRTELQNTTQLAFELPTSPNPQTLPLEIERFASDYTDSETIRAQIDLYTELLAEDIQYIQTLNAHVIQARVLPQYKDFPIRASLSIPSHSAQAISAQADGDLISFRLPTEINGCHTVKIAPENATAIEAEICFELPKREFFSWLAALAPILLALGAYLIVKYHDRPKLPPAPNRTSRAQSVDHWPIHIPAKALKTVAPGMAEILCIDANSQRPLAHDAVTIRANDQPIAHDHWPLACPLQTQITISAPDYLPFNSAFDKPGRHVVSLKNRRDYIAECFENTARHITGTTVEWGEMTPAALRLSRNDQNLEKFCNCIEDAAFGNDHISDAQIDEIYRLMRKLPRR